MKRRRLIVLLGGSLAWPFVARGQQKPKPMIGFLTSGIPTPSDMAAFRQGLSESGYVEGQNAAIEHRDAEGDHDRLPEFAADLVDRKVDVIVAIGGAAAVAKSATSTIPIVFAGIGRDPVELGLVTSLARPDSNLTGDSNIAAELNPKRFEPLSELVPQAKVIALLQNPKNAIPNAERTLRELQEAARDKAVRLEVLKAGTESEIDAAFATLVALRVGALFVVGDPFFFSRREQLVALASRHGVPVSTMWREVTAAGGLISYGVRITWSFRQAGIYTGRILKGEKPADLPVMQPTKFELVVNLKTAKALGVIVPQSILARADEVIE